MLETSGLPLPNSLGRQFLAPKTVAFRLGLQPRAIYKAIEAGELRAHRFRNRLRIRESDLDQYIEGSIV